jgi:hypothetical protein
MRNLLFAVLLISFHPIYSQTSDDSITKFWVTDGVGVYYSSSSEGFGFNVSADYLKNQNYWKLRYIRISEFYIFGPNPSELFNDIGLLYGRVTKSKIIRLSISGGIGVLAGTMRGAFLHSGTGWFPSDVYEHKHILTPTIPLELELSLIPIKYIGVGIAGFANLNFENSMVGFMIKIEFGRIR